MPRKKKAEVMAEIVSKGKISAASLSIEDRLIACAKGDKDSIEYVGNLVERELNGEFGAIIKALTAGRVSMELNAAKTSGKSSDWHLGRASMGNDLWNDLENYVNDKEVILHERIEEKLRDESDQED